MTTESPRFEAADTEVKQDKVTGQRSPRKVQFAETSAVHANGSIGPGSDPSSESSPQATASGQASPMQVSPFARASRTASYEEAGDEEVRDASMAARAVSWQDMYGRELVTVREFEPSEAGGSDTSKGHWGETHKGCCSVM